MFIIVMCLFIIDWNVRLTKTAGLCYSKRERKYNVETRTARIELSTKVNILSNFLYTLVPGDRFSRQTERHSYPRNVPRRFLGGLGLQVAFVFLFYCSIDFTIFYWVFHLPSIRVMFAEMDMDHSGAVGLSRP